MESIRKISQKIKIFTSVYEKELLTTVGVLFIPFFIYGVIRIIIIEGEREPVKVIISSFPVKGGEIKSQEEGILVGSKNGTKYHYPWCPGAERILDKNLVRFSSKEEAEERGYTPASNCPRL